MYTKFGWVWSKRARIFIFDSPPRPILKGCWKIESLDLGNFSFVYVTNSTSRRNFMMLEWLEVPYRFWWPVSQWVPKLAIFSGQYLRTYLSYIIEIWYSLQAGLHNYMCIISALYLKWVPSCRGVEIGSKWFVYVQVNARTWPAHAVRFDFYIYL